MKMLHEDNLRREALGFTYDIDFSEYIFDD